MIRQMIGVMIAVRTVLSVTCPAAWGEPFPGGRCGPRTKITSKVAIKLVTIVRRAIRRRWFASPDSDDIQEAVHVADRLHRSGEPVDEPRGAGYEALPTQTAA